MRFLLLLILLAFPALDLYVTLRFAQWTGVPVWIWLGLSLLTGLLILQNERNAFRARTVAALHGQQLLLRGVVDSGRKVLAGVLLLIPGVVTDLMAIALLMLPINTGSTLRHGPAAAGNGAAPSRTFDGDYRRVE